MVWKENGENAYCEITPAILALKEQWEKKNYIDPRLYKEYNVKRGLRDEDGRGVLTGLTRVGEIQSYRWCRTGRGAHPPHGRRALLPGHRRPGAGAGLRGPAVRL